MIAQDNLQENGKVKANASASASVNANGNSPQLPLMDDHDNNTDQSQHAQERLLTVIKNSFATQTTEDEMLKALKELADKYSKLEETIEDPRNGLSSQLAKTQEKLSNLHTDVHGAVDRILVKLQAVTETATSNTAKIQSMETAQARMLALLDENKRLVKEL